MPARASVSDVRALNAFPDGTVISNEKVDSWLTMRAGELDMLLVRKGVILPLREPVDANDPIRALRETLKLAETYGAGAMLENAPIAGKPITGESVNLYLQEYTRLYKQIADLTTDDLIRVGAIASPSTPTGSGLGSGFALVGNSHVSETTEDWRGYPFR